MKRDTKKAGHRMEEWAEEAKDKEPFFSFLIIIQNRTAVAVITNRLVKSEL